MQRGLERSALSIVKSIIFIIVYLILFFQFAVASERECEKCHQPVYSEISKFKFQHADFVREGCKGCHIYGESPGNRLKWKRKVKREVRWNRIPLKVYAEEHLAVLETLSMDSSYHFRIKVVDRAGKKNASQTIQIVPSAITEFWTDDELKPYISGTDVKKIDFAIFTSADIEWVTDKFSDSTVESGLTKEYGFLSRSGSYARKHTIRLNGLSHNRTYHYRVISSDPFGNRAFSNDLIFNTSKSFNKTPNTLNDAGDKGKPEFKMIKFVRLKPKNRKRPDFNKVAILFTASREVTAFVEYIKKSGKGEIPEEEKHGVSGLKSRREVGIDVCVSCHAQGASHPVGVRGRGNIIIPDSFPTAEGGIMTCVTCHLPHGGDIRSLARLDFNRDICVLCHQDKN